MVLVTCATRTTPKPRTVAKAYRAAASISTATIPSALVWGAPLALSDMHADRVASVIVGGMPPDLPPDVQRALTAPWIEALQDSDWGGFWKTLLPIREENRQRMEARNDPIAVAAFVAGRAATARALTSLSAPTLCYLGTAEVFFDPARDTAASIGAEFVAIDGLGHDEASIEVERVKPAIDEFLGRAPSTRATRPATGVG